jgi:hypothetical protein
MNERTHGTVKPATRTPKNAGSTGSLGTNIGPAQFQQRR